MDENKVRTLPPLVYGKLSGILDFVFDKIELLGQAINKHATCSLAVNVLWWGETKPLFIRPKIIEILTKDEKKQTFINEHGGNSVKYEIKTKLNLFKSYLAKCDLMELTVYDTLNNEVIGSAFLKDLINLVFSFHSFSNSIINHMGEVVGEITYHFTFCEMMSKESPAKIIQYNFRSDLDNLSNNINTKNLILNLSELDSHIDDAFTDNKSNEKYLTQNTVLAKKGKIYNSLDDNEFQCNTNLHYNSPVVQNFESQLTEIEALKDQKHLQNENLLEPDNSVNPNTKYKDHQRLKISAAMDNDKQNNFIRDCVNNTGVKKVLTGTSRITPSVVKKKTNTVESNKITKLNTLSKDLKQRESSGKAKNMNSKNPVKFSIKKIPYNKNENSTKKNIAENKTTGLNLTIRLEKKNKISNTSDAANYINMKNRPKPGRNRNCSLKSTMKPTEKLKSIENVSNEISKINKICYNSSRSSKDKHSDLEKLTVQDSCQDLRNNKILQHSKDEINYKIDVDSDMVKMASNIEHIKQIESKLCKREKSEFNEKTALDYERSSSARFSAHIRINENKKLCFDLNDPIERLYYETFFLNTTCQNTEFEIAEMLNQTPDKYMLIQTPCNRVNYNESAFSRDEQTAANQLKSEFKTKYNYAPKKKNRQSFQVVNDKIHENCSDSFEEEYDNLSRISEEKFSSILKNELIEKKTNSNNRNEILSFGSQQKENSVKTEVFPYCFDCHCFIYSKKLKELDKIIGTLKNFETDLKEAKFPTQSFESNNVKEIINESGLAEYFENGKENYALDEKEKCPDREILKTNSNESDYSKEDSDFIEFTHYMTKQ